MMVMPLLIFKDNLLSQDNPKAAEVVNYDNSGEIVSWFVYSDVLNDWVGINLLEAQGRFPEKWNSVKLKIDKKLHDSRSFFGIDESGFVKKKLVPAHPGSP
jgi:hypothetical protein